MTPRPSARGSTAPRPRRPVPRYPRVRWAAVIVLLILLIGPVAALVKISRWLDWQVVLGYVVFISFSTYTIYRKDKRQAESNGQRTPESMLHFLEFAGGWPAAFLAQRLLRHKIVKRIYQVNFWGIVGVHEYVAFDFLQEWQLTSGAVVWVHALLSQG